MTNGAAGLLLPYYVNTKGKSAWDQDWHFDRDPCGPSRDHSWQAGSHCLYPVSPVSIASIMPYPFHGPHSCDSGPWGSLRTWLDICPDATAPDVNHPYLWLTWGVRDNKQPVIQFNVGGATTVPHKSCSTFRVESCMFQNIPNRTVTRFRWGEICAPPTALNSRSTKPQAYGPEADSGKFSWMLIHFHAYSGKFSWMLIHFHAYSGKFSWMLIHFHTVQTKSQWKKKSAGLKPQC